MKMHVTDARQHQAHVLMAWAWFMFGVYGLIEYILDKGFDIHLFGVVNSIPVLFAISVYANFVGHLASAEAASAKIEAASHHPPNGHDE